MANVLMSIILVFFSCHSTKIVVNFYEALQVSFPSVDFSLGFLFRLVSELSLVAFSLCSFRFRQFSLYVDFSSSSFLFMQLSLYVAFSLCSFLFMQFSLYVAFALRSFLFKQISLYVAFSLTILSIIVRFFLFILPSK